VSPLQQSRHLFFTRFTGLEWLGTRNETT
jgi:hypothetical protein